MKKFILVFILFLLPVLVLAEEAVRTWTTSAGKEMPGVWEMEKDTDEEKIHIRSNGKLYRVKVEKLSEADQTYIAEKRAASRSIDDDAFEEVVEEPEAGEKAIVVVERDGLREEAHRYALLIGVNEYNKPISSLKFCMNDMKHLAETFEAIGFQRENITLMTDESASNLRPTRANILNQVEMLCEMMSPEDLLIIAFSGHGVMVDGKAYLCPGDANAENADSLVSRDWVYEQLETSQAAQKLMIVDAC
ncbi:MAG: caspase family protein, partial [Thermoguttaceae bacterium]|nr:caspase family protein [Thermoguttaceae bacterium]